VAILFIAENAAKVIYNASVVLDHNNPAPFDHDSGWWLVSTFRHVVDLINDAEFASEAWQVVSCEQYG